MKKVSLIVMLALVAALFCGCMTVQGFYDNSGQLTCSPENWNAVSASGYIIAELKENERNGTTEISRAEAGSWLEYLEEYPLKMHCLTDPSQTVTVAASDVEFYDYEFYNGSNNAKCKIKITYRNLMPGATYRLGSLQLNNPISGFQVKVHFAGNDQQPVLSEDVYLALEGLPLDGHENYIEFTVAAEPEKTPEQGPKEVAPQVFATPTPEPTQPVVDVEEATDEIAEEEPDVVEPAPEEAPEEPVEEEEAPATGDNAASLFAVAGALGAMILAAGLCWKKVRR